MSGPSSMRRAARQACTRCRPAGGGSTRWRCWSSRSLNKTAPVPCVVSDAANGILIDEVSLAEKIERAPLHPLDQYRAFQAMRDKGMTEETIAAAFFVGVNVVKQRLRLAAVSPVLLAIYAKDGMTLEQLMAFTVSPDHARREQVWDAIQKSYNREAWQIRRMLTEAAVRASDKRARFVGIEAYETEGGVVLRDLFESDDFGWLPEPLRLDPAEDAATVTGFDPDSDADEGRNLPAFLSDDPDDEDRADGAGEAELLAAE